MVVILLISMLAVMAVPTMRQSRDDRMAFDYARQYSQVIHRASMRATARGAAQLVVISAASGSRGHIWMFEAVDGTAPPTGPRQVGSCKVPGQWAGLSSWTPAVPSLPLAPIIDGLDLDTTGVNVDMNIGSTVMVDGTTKGTAVLCYTPGGNVYAGSGADVDSAVSAMQTSTPFTGALQVRIQRRTASNAALGLARYVIVAGAAAPRLQSI